MVGYKVMWCLIHSGKQVVAFIDDYGSVTPCKNGSKKSRNFNVLLFGKAVGDADGIIFNKRGFVVLFNFTVKEVFQVVAGVLLHAVKLSEARLGRIAMYAPMNYQ